MTPAQIDLQKQLEQATADLTTRPLLNDSPVLYIDTSEPTPSNSLEQMEHSKLEHDTSKIPTPPDDTDRTNRTDRTSRTNPPDRVDSETLDGDLNLKI